MFSVASPYCHLQALPTVCACREPAAAGKTDTPEHRSGRTTDAEGSTTHGAVNAASSMQSQWHNEQTIGSARRVRWGLSVHQGLHALAHARERPSAHKHQRERSVRGDELRFVLRPTFSLRLRRDTVAASRQQEKAPRFCALRGRSSRTWSFCSGECLFVHLRTVLSVGLNAADSILD